MAKGTKGDEESPIQEEPEAGQSNSFKGYVQWLCFSLLDCVALMCRGVLGCFKGIVWCLQRCCYPMKELFFDLVDTLSSTGMEKRPNRGVPGFRYTEGIGASKKPPAAKGTFQY
mmetsp:Transcript_58337/g.126117  ORF Transcript_58337/g.126117 Transcript_58337/m.126117 type:complete len:114 (+) Transcript_58337:108-449(+)